MNIRFAAAGALAVALTALSAMPAAAQTTRPSAPTASNASDGFPPMSFDGSLNVGMSVLNRGVTNTYHPGWIFGASINATSFINVIASMSADYRDATGYTANIYSYGGGVRFESIRSPKKVRPYIQVLLGGAQDNGDGTGKTNHYPFVSPGGGATFVINKRAAVRAMVDFPLYCTFGDVYKGRRFSAGFVVPIGMAR
jgi:hypothetical protein